MTKLRPSAERSHVPMGITRDAHRSALVVLDAAGVAVFAASGALAAMHAGLDLLGVIVLASVTAVGGGTIRDVLLARHPIFWIASTTPLVVVLCAAVVTMIGARLLAVPQQALLDADAMGLALFAMSGARMALDDRHPMLVVILAGTLSGSGGGVIRDLLLARTPAILERDIYASAAIAGIAIYLLLQRGGIGERTAFTIGLVIIVAIRTLSLRYGWSLPHDWALAS